MIDYEKLWNKLRDIVNSHEEAEERMYDNSRSESIRTYLHGRIDAFLTIEDLMDGMLEDAEYGEN